MAEHEIVWKLDGGSVVAELVCNDTECEYAWTCPEGCPVLTDQERTETGYRHRAHQSLTGLADVWHDMEPAECNFETWLNADRYMIPELNDCTTVFEIGRTTVEPVWMGEDGTNWLRPEDRTSPDSSIGKAEH